MKWNLRAPLPSLGDFSEREVDRILQPGRTDSSRTRVMSVRLSKNLSVNDLQRLRAKHESMQTDRNTTFRLKGASTHHKIKSLQKLLKKPKKKENVLKLLTIPEALKQECFEAFDRSSVKLSDAELERLSNQEALNAWVAVNTVTFYNELTIAYEFVEEFHTAIGVSNGYKMLYNRFNTTTDFPEFNHGFSPELTYDLDAEHNKGRTGADFVDISLIWLEDQIENPDIFPEDEESEFPENFVEEYIKDMFVVMLRIYAIVFGVCWVEVKNKELDEKLLLNFRKFYLFSLHFNLMEDRDEEIDAMKIESVRKVVDIEHLTQEYEMLTQVEKLGATEEI